LANDPRKRSANIQPYLDRGFVAQVIAPDQPGNFWAEGVLPAQLLRLSHPLKRPS
jgi:hypothetical protein